MAGDRQRLDDGGGWGRFNRRTDVSAGMLETITKYRYKLWPDKIFGELLQKRWMENSVTVIVLIITIAFFSERVQNFISVANLSNSLREASELGFVVMGMSLVLIVGGIDLSVGSMFGLCNLIALYCVHVLALPIAAAITITLLSGAVLGAVNGVLVGYMRMRAFLTTMVTLILYKAIFDLLAYRWSVAISSVVPDSDAWDFVGSGAFLSIPTVVWVFAIVAIASHIFLTRLRAGWHVMAVGGNRRSSYNLGLKVNAVVAGSYCASGVFTAISAVFYAARLASAGADTGKGMEIIVLTAAILGGIRLGGGKGSVAKVVLGTLIVFLLTNGLLRLAVPAGQSRLILAGVLLFAATVDIRWSKNRHKAVQELYVSPSYLALPPAPPTAAGLDSNYAVNHKLRTVEVIGLGMVESPEDVILDDDDNLYCGSRHGEIIRFFAPDYKRMEVYAHIGGQPLGLAFDGHNNLYACVGGMGLYRVTPDAPSGESRPTKRTARCCRSSTTAAYASPTTSTSRPTAASSSPRRPCATRCTNGRPTRSRGAATAVSFATILSSRRRRPSCAILSSRTASRWPATDSRFSSRRAWACSIKRYWFDGPKKGDVETVIDSLPGYPDNINRASDGNYWLALARHAQPAVRPCNAQCRAFGAGCRSNCRATNGSPRTSTPAASSNSTRTAKCSTRFGISAASTTR